MHRLEAFFPTPMDHLVESLEEELSREKFYMIAICSHDISSLPLHCLYVFIVPLAEVVHASQQVLLFSSDLIKFIFKSALFTLAVHLLTSQVFKLICKLPKSLNILFMLSLESLQFISLFLKVTLNSI